LKTRAVLDFWNQKVGIVVTDWMGIALAEVKKAIVRQEKSLNRRFDLLFFYISDNFLSGVFKHFGNFNMVQSNCLIKWSK
jgi:hypothetical protein